MAGRTKKRAQRVPERSTWNPQSGGAHRSKPKPAPAVAHRQLSPLQRLARAFRTA